MATSCPTTPRKRAAPASSPSSLPDRAASAVLEPSTPLEAEPSETPSAVSRPLVLWRAGMAPVLVVWETTLACNLACRHCGSSAGAPRAGELTPEEGLSLLETLRALGTQEVTFSGGEFFLRADWEALLSRGRELGLSCLIVSNGLCIPPEVAARVAERGVHSVTLSLDGPQAVHDALRPVRAQPGLPLSGPSRQPKVSSYEQLVHAWHNLQAAGVKVAIITQVSQANLEALPALYAWLVETGVRAWQLQLTNPMGRAARGVKALEPDQLPTLYHFLRQVQQEGRIRCQPADCIGYFGRDELELRQERRPGDSFWTGCQAGLQVLGITADGGLKGCLSLPDGFVEGNLRDGGLAALWADPERFAYNRRFSPASLTGACASCAFGRLCRAGCHSFTASQQAGDISCNPWCIRRHEAARPATWVTGTGSP